jgi:hypothetical protein
MVNLNSEKLVIIDVALLKKLVIIDVVLVIIGVALVIIDVAPPQQLIDFKRKNSTFFSLLSITNNTIPTGLESRPAVSETRASPQGEENSGVCSGSVQNPTLRNIFP